MNSENTPTKDKSKKTIIHFRPIFFAFLSLLIGIIFARRIYYGNLEYIILTIVLFAVLFLVCFYQKRFVPFLICVFIFAIGNGLFFLSEKPFNDLPNYEGYVSVVGRVADDFEDHGNKISFTLEDVKINGKESKNIYLTTDNGEKIQTGLTLVFEAIVTKQPLFEFGNFRTDYTRNNVAYYASVDIENVKVFPGKMKFDEKVRLKIKEALLSGMSEENAYIAYAVLTGEKSGIDHDIYENYKHAGIVHLLCVSGLHVGIFAGFLAFILKLCKVNKWVRFGITFAVLLLYMYICGFVPSVVRASIMSLVFLLAFIVGKQNDSLSSVGLAGIIICLINPFYAFDVGFLMSFFCIVLINLLYRPIFKILGKILPKWIGSYLSLSICASLATIPFLASFYNSYNFLSLIANVIVVPLFSFVFIALLILTILSAIMYFLSPLLIISDYMFMALNWMASFYNTPILSVNMTPLNPEITAFAFLLIFSLSNFLMVGAKNRMIIASVFACFFIISCALSFIPVNNKDSEVHYVSSYDSSSLLLRSKNGSSMIVGDVNPYFTKRHFDYISQGDVDYCISAYKHGKETLSFLENRDLIQDYVYDLSEESLGSIFIEPNKELHIGDFHVKICEYDNVKLGIQIDFDELSLFFAFTEVLSYNEREYIINNVEQVDIVFAEYNRDIMKLIVANTTISKPYYGEADYSHGVFGNIIATKIGNKIKVRCLDWKH